MSRRHRSETSQDSFYSNHHNLSIESQTISSSSPCTINAIRELGNGFYMTADTITSPSTEVTHRNNRNCEVSSYSDCHRTYRQCDSSNSHFTSLITPVTNLTPQYSGSKGVVEFRMRRKNKTVTLQWEPYSGTMAASGTAFLTAMQSIANVPPYPISIPIYIKYKDVNRVTNMTIDPSSTTGNIRFYLNSDGTGTDINMGDTFYVYGGSISWIVD